ncbi:MAG: radical SAM protein [bacterium]
MAGIVIIYPREKNPPLEINSFRARMPRYGVLSVASYLKAHGHSVQVFCELIGSKVDWEAVRKADYVCFSFLSFCASRAYEMADRVRREYKRTVIMGGDHSSVMPEDALDHADYVVRNEGEETLLALIDVLESGGDTSSVEGVSYRDKAGKPVHNKDRPFLEDLSFSLDLDLLPEYRSKGLFRSIADAFANGAPRVPMPVVQASRGCPENCRFCVVKYQLGNRHRKRPMDVVLSEIDDYLKRFRGPYLFFVDNDMSVDSRFSCDLFRTLLQRHGPHLRPYVFCRIGVNTNHELLSILEKFDHTTMGIGFESLRDTALDELGKGHKSGDILKAVENLRRYRINIHGLFIFGGENDAVEDIRRTIEFCLGRGFFNVGLTPLYDFPTRQAVLGQPQMIPDHLFIHRDWRFYSGNFAVHFPRLMRPSELQRGILEGYQTFYRHSPNSMVPFMPVRPTMIRYIDYLREIEVPFYGPDGRRLDKKLEGRTLQDLSPRVPVHVPPWALYRETSRFLFQNIFRGVSWRLLRGVLFPDRKDGINCVF